MGMQRRISWSSAVRDMRNDRTVRSGIYEQKLRTPGTSSWRGRSGKFYAVGKRPLTADAVIDVCAAVVIAVRRDEVGIAKVVSVASAIGIGSRVEVEMWVEAARESGANELHVHRLAETTFERVAVVEDLTNAIDLSVEA